MALHIRLGKRRIGRLAAAALGAALTVFASAASAHHSFTAFFNSDAGLVTVTGVVKEFRFSNPHGLVEIVSRGADGESTTPRRSYPGSQRHGWTKDSLKLGETITVRGWRCSGRHPLHAPARCRSR